MCALCNSPDENAKSAVALTLHAITVHSLDTAKTMASEFVSLVFLAMHEQVKDDGKLKRQ